MTLKWLLAIRRTQLGATCLPLLHRIDWHDDSLRLLNKNEFSINLHFNLLGRRCFVPVFCLIARNDCQLVTETMNWTTINDFQFYCSVRKTCFKGFHSRWEAFGNLWVLHICWFPCTSDSLRCRNSQQHIPRDKAVLWVRWRIFFVNQEMFLFLIKLTRILHNKICSGHTCCT